MATLSDVIGRGATGSKPAAGDVPVGSLYYDTTLEKMQRSSGAAWEDCEPSGGGFGDVTYAALLASQLCNEIKGWPPVVNTGNLDALNLWWDKVSTPTTAPSVVAISGEGITEQYRLAMKVVADAANEGLCQRWTYADEPRVKSGRALSTLWAIWCGNGVGVTAKLVNSDASETVAAKVTAAGWSIVEIPNHTLAGTWCEVRLLTDGAGTFYAVPLGANIGARAFPLRPRGLCYVGLDSYSHVVDLDPNGADFTDANFAAVTSPLAVMVNLYCGYANASAANVSLRIRRNGNGLSTGTVVTRNLSTTVSGAARVVEFCDDGQVIEYKSDAVAANTETITIGPLGYWEWE